ncbi:MAG: rhodanese-like domain-containing protein [Lachnospiraceae bacterium]|nr:rhodanese-like domain-containing protein [Lachnospiraceae bacterium]
MTFGIVYPKDIEVLRSEKRAILIDIRPRSAYQEGHWSGAINFPETEVEDYRKVLQKKRPIILYCQHGGSSMQLARALGRAGYEVATVVGGYEAMKKIQKKIHSRH